VDLRAPIFYDSNNTGYYVDPNSVSVFSDIRINDGNVQLRSGNTGRNTKWRQLEGSTDIGISFYNAADTWCMQLYANNGGEYGFLNGNWAAWDIRKVPNGNMYMNNNNSYYLNAPSDNYMYRVYGAADTRSPIYYDLDNTGYYCDPNGTTYLNVFTTANYISAGSYIRSGGNVYTDANYGYGLVGAYASTRYQGVFAMGDSYKLAADGTTTGTLYGLAWSHPNAGGVAANLNTHGLLAMENGTWLASLTGSTRARDDMRAPIFYDNNDTGYFADPNSTSRMYQINFNYLYWAGDSSYGFISNNVYADTLNSGYSYDPLELCYVRGTWCGISHDSLRAPLFYDYDNTSYYCDPAGTSTINYIRTNNTLNIGGWGESVATSSFRGIEFHSEGNRDYFIGKPAGAWTQPLDVHFYTGVRLTAHQSYDYGVSMWNIYSGNVIASFAAGDDYIRLYRNTYAPIVYDYNNTGYYVNPDSTSNMYAVISYSYQGNGNVGGTGSASWHPSGIYSAGYNWLYGGINGGGSSGTNFSDLRANIFYDYNDTSYYTSPNSSSQFSLVYANDWFRPQGGCGVYWESYGRGIRAADNEYSYGNIGTYGSGLNGWRGYAVYPNNCILMANGSTFGFYNPTSGVWVMQTSDTVGSNMTFYGNVTAYSDLRLKQNVREIDNVVARRDALAVSAIKYERDGRTRIGYGAQTLRENGCGEFVHESDDNLKLVTGLGTLSVDYGETAAVLAVASKLTDDRVAQLEARIQYLESVIEKLIGD
jgi:hypothetical protein